MILEQIVCLYLSLSQVFLLFSPHPSLSTRFSLSIPISPLSLPLSLMSVTPPHSHSPPHPISLTHLSQSLCFSLLVSLFINRGIYPSISPAVRLSVCLSFHLSVCLSICLSIDLFICLFMFPIHFLFLQISLNVIIFLKYLCSNAIYSRTLFCIVRLLS